MGDRASLESDGTCKLFDWIEESYTASWPSLAAWATAMIDEWSSGEWGPAHEFVSAVTDEPAPWAVDALVVLAEAAVESGDLPNVGAGPLEDLVSHRGRGAMVLAAVEAAARRSPAFRDAVSCLWLSDAVPVHVRHRLAELGARDFVAEHSMTPTEFAAYARDREARGLG